MFSCKICKEKNERIADLKAQIEYLQKNLANYTNPVYTRAVEAEADVVLNGASNFVETLSQEQKSHADAVEAQALALLTGRY